MALYNALFSPKPGAQRTPFTTARASSLLALELKLHPSRFYQLRTDDLRACAQGHADTWTPQTSGGDHQPDWPAGVRALLTRLLASRPPSSYSAAASELHRRLDFKTDRASVRRWALENKLAPDTRYKATPKPVKRWQARDDGALWQYDATPHAFLPGTTDKQCLLDLLDDATRYNTGARLYPGETLLAHLDFLSRVFQAHGLPLALSVDYHSFFYTHTPDAFTQLGTALHFHGVALRHAPTPQARGKIERRHDCWQKRLPPLLAADSILELEGANRLLDQLLPHVNAREIHRELGTTPLAARAQALAEKRSVLRPAPPVSLVALRLEPANPRARRRRRHRPCRPPAPVHRSAATRHRHPLPAARWGHLPPPPHP
jgi:transposase InsO family protein